MKELEFSINGNSNEILRFEVKNIINAGYTGRNQEEVKKHIKELAVQGIPTPDEVPKYFPKFNNGIVQDKELDALDESNHSGEAEFALLCTEEEIYIAAGSDHTDRQLEEENIPKAKQIYPNVISKNVWKLSEVEAYWDELVLKSWVEKEGKKVLFQEAKLSALFSPAELLKRIKSFTELASIEGLVIYSGTVGAEIEIEYSPYFEVVIEDPRREKSLSCKYRMKPMNSWYKKEIK